jgi:DNA repair photolyase
MNIIYEPKGKAREYSPYALNIYKGCDHDCKYCYVKNMYGYKPENNQNPYPREKIAEELVKQLQKTKINKQVLLSFSSDPYCKAEMRYNKTSQILEILNIYNIPTAILTKGGIRLLKDIELIKRFKTIKIGATLTFTKRKDSLYWEPGASLPEERIEMLKELHKEGIRTWVSFEPVINPKQTMDLLDKTVNFVDEYQVGKINYFNVLERSINWEKFGNYIANKLIEYKKEFYIKEGLYKYITIKLDNKYIEKDYLTLENKEIFEAQYSLF